MDTPHHENQPGKKESARTPVHDAAHDLNNVMMTIAGSAELLLEGAGDNQQLKIWAEHILHASQEGIVLVNSLKTSASTVTRKKSTSSEQGKVSA